MIKKDNRSKEEYNKGENTVSGGAGGPRFSDQRTRTTESREGIGENIRLRNTKRGMRSKGAVEYRKIKRSVNRSIGRTETRKNTKTTNDIPSRPPEGGSGTGKGGDGRIT